MEEGGVVGEQEKVDEGEAWTQATSLGAYPLNGGPIPSEWSDSQTRSSCNVGLIPKLMFKSCSQASILAEVWE